MNRLVYVAAVAFALVAASCSQGLAPPEAEARTTIYASEAFWSRVAVDAFGPQVVGAWEWSQGGGGCEGFKDGERELVSTMQLAGAFSWPKSRDSFEAAILAAGGELTDSTNFVGSGNGADFGAPRGLGGGRYEFEAGLAVADDGAAFMRYTFGCFPFGSSENP